MKKLRMYLIALMITAINLYSANYLLAMANNGITIEQAKAIGKDYIESVHYFDSDEVVNIEADEYNTSWAEYIRLNQYLLNSPTIKRKIKTLDKKSFWAIKYWVKKPPNYAGGDTAFVFISKDTGEIIEKILFK